MGATLGTRARRCASLQVVPRAESERGTPQKVVDATKLAVLAESSAIAQEGVTPMRLAHVLDKRRIGGDDIPPSNEYRGAAQGCSAREVTDE
jgi:hypothetical protein